MTNSVSLNDSASSLLYFSASLFSPPLNILELFLGTIHRQRIGHSLEKEEEEEKVKLRHFVTMNVPLPNLQPVNEASEVVAQQKTKRSRWDIQSNFDSNDGSSDLGPVAADATETLKNFNEDQDPCCVSQEKNEKALLVLTYPRLLPLDTPRLRTELIGRLQLVLWGQKTLYQNLLKDFQNEKKKNVFLIQLIHSILSFVIRLKLSLKTEDLDFSSSNMLNGDDQSDTKHVLLHHDPVFSRVDTKEGDHDENVEHVKHGESTCDVFIECFHTILKFAWSMSEEYIEFQGDNDRVLRTIESFLQRLLCSKRFIPSVEVSPEHAPLLEKLLFENERLTSSLMCCEKKYQHLELLLEQCRKQISIYLSRDPATPQVVDLDQVLKTAEEFKAEAPEVFLAMIPKLVRTLQSMEEAKKLRSRMLEESLSSLEALKKELCEKDLCIHRLEVHIASLSSQTSERREAAKSETQKLYHLEERLKQVSIERLELLERLNHLSISKKNRDTEVESILRERCHLLQSQKDNLEERDHQLSSRFAELEKQNLNLNTRVTELEERCSGLHENLEKERQAMRQLIQMTTQQRQSLISSKELPRNEEASLALTKASSSQDINSLIRQRNHLTAELDELSNLLEEKLSMLSQLEERCKERDARCLSIVEEGLQRQKDNEKMEQQMKQLLSQVKDQKKVIDNQSQELKAQLNSFHDYMKEQEEMLSQREYYKELKRCQEESAEKTAQVKGLEMKLQQLEEKYKDIESSNTFLLKRFEALSKEQIHAQFQIPLDEELSSTAPPQVSPFLHKKKNQTPKSESAGSEGKTLDKDKNDPTRTLQLELEALRRRFLCTLCNERWKNAFIKKCGHSFCDECLKNTLSSRNRKCPHCNQKYQAVDIQRLFGP